MVKIFQITDCHLYADKTKLLNGACCFETTSAVIEKIITQKGPADLVFITGDVTNDDSKESYEHLLQMLSKNNLQAYFIPGNHDVDKLMKKALSPVSLGFAPNIIELEQHIVVLLTSTVPREDLGLLTAESFALLTRGNQQGQETQKEVIVFLHHHLMPINGFVDKYIVTNYQEVLGHIAQLKQIKFVVCGHVHQEFAQELNGVMYLATPSTCYQIKPGQQKFTVDSKLGPGYRVLELSSSGVTTRVHRL